MDIDNLQIVNGVYAGPTSLSPGAPLRPLSAGTPGPFVGQGAEFTQVLLAFADAGWRFYQSAETPTALLRSGSIAPVATDPCGRIGVLSGRAVVARSDVVRAADGGFEITRFSDRFSIFTTRDRDRLFDRLRELKRQAEGALVEPELFVRVVNPERTPRNADTSQDNGAQTPLPTSQGISVGIIDQGFDPDHQDLTFSRPTTMRFDAATGSIVVESKLKRPIRSHGTEIASVIAGHSVKGYLRGIAPSTELVPVAVDCVTSELVLAEAIKYLATTQNVDVIVGALNLFPQDCKLGSVAIQEAVTVAEAKGRGLLGCPIVWAIAPHAGPVLDNPLCSALPVIAVANVNAKGIRDYGETGPTLVAMATDLLVADKTTLTNKAPYCIDGGHSLAAPIVAAGLALCLEQDPKLTAPALRKILTDSCCPISGGQDVGSGLVSIPRGKYLASGGAIGTMPGC